MADDLLTVIIVDDEQPARAVLKGLLETHCPMLKTVAECANADEAFEKITNLKPGLVFLDIEMPRSSGFDLLRRFGKINFRVIFTTAFSEYALQAFRFSAVDYLLKPLKAEELVEAVAKFRLELEANQRLERIQVLLDNLRARDENSKRIVVADSKGFSVIDISNLIFCEADGYCTLFYLEGDKVISSSKHLGYYEDLLPPTLFIRPHHSYLVNTRHVKGYSSANEEISLTGDLRCPLGNAGKKEFLAFFKQFK